MQLQQIRRKKVPCIDEYPDLGPKAEGTNTNPLLVGFACYPWDSSSKDCFGNGAAAGCTDASGTWTSQWNHIHSCAGWCPDPKVKTASGTSRRLEKEENSWAERWFGLGGEYWDDLGRRLASPTRASKVRGKAKEILADGPDTFEGGVYTVTLHEHEGLTE